MVPADHRVLPEGGEDGKVHISLRRLHRECGQNFWRGTGVPRSFKTEIHTRDGGEYSTNLTIGQVREMILNVMRMSGAPIEVRDAPTE